MRAASAGVATPPAAKFTTGSLPVRATSFTSSYGACVTTTDHHHTKPHHHVSTTCAMVVVCLLARLTWMSLA